MTCETSSAHATISYRTEEAYLNWIRQYVPFHGKPEVGEFLPHLAIKREVAASTQNQALAALLFLYKDVLKQDLPWLKDIERPNDRRAFLSFSRERKLSACSRNWSNTTGCQRVCFTEQGFAAENV